MGELTPESAWPQSGLDLSNARRVLPPDSALVRAALKEVGVGRSGPLREGRPIHPVAVEDVVNLAGRRQPLPHALARMLLQAACGLRWRVTAARTAGGTRDHFPPPRIGKGGRGYRVRFRIIRGTHGLPLAGR